MMYRPDCSDMACSSTLAHAGLPISCPTEPPPCFLPKPGDTFKNHLGSEEKRLCNTQNLLGDLFSFLSPPCLCERIRLNLKNPNHQQTKIIHFLVYHNALLLSAVGR